MFRRPILCRSPIRTPILRKLCAAAAGGCLAAAATVSEARADFAEEFTGLLYQGRTAEAAMLAADTDDANKARFALGAAQFLQAVENLGQGLHRYGLQTEYGDAAGAGGLGILPFLRLPVPPNPNPDSVSYAALRHILQRFSDDLAVAEDTLAAVGAAAFDLPVDLDRVLLNFSGDGSDREALMQTVRAIVGPMQSEGAYVVDFDQSDAPWLRGYCHLLSALVEFLLAHEWENTYQKTFHNLFPESDLPSSDLTVKRQLDRIVKRMQELENPDGSPLRYEAGDGDYETWKNSDEGRRTAEYNRLLHKLQSGGMVASNYMDIRELGGIADLVGFIHLFNWPVTEPGRMSHVRTHLLEMISLSRENWDRILSETDDAREWVPGPDQTGIFQAIRVDERNHLGWMMFLDEFEAILNGDRLVPHWRFLDGGINVRRMFEEPQTFDPVLIAQGSAVVRYIEEGELVGGDTAMSIISLLDGALLAYFLWFN